MNIPQLIMQLNSAAIKDQNQAAYQLGMLGNIAAMAIPDLLVAYKNQHLRYNVQWALAKISAPPVAIASELISTLKDKDTAIQEYAVWALGTRRVFTAIKPEHLPLFLQTFQKGSDYTKQCLVWLIAKADLLSAAAPIMRTVLHTGTGYLCVSLASYIVRALHGYVTWNIEELQTMLQLPNAVMQKYALVQLGNMDEVIDALPLLWENESLLKKAYCDPLAEVSSSAIRLLRKMVIEDGHMEHSYLRTESRRLQKLLLTTNEEEYFHSDQQLKDFIFANTSTTISRADQLPAYVWKPVVTDLPPLNIGKDALELPPLTPPEKPPLLRQAPTSPHVISTLVGGMPPMISRPDVIRAPVTARRRGFALGVPGIAAPKIKKRKKKPDVKREHKPKPARKAIKKAPEAISPEVDERRISTLRETIERKRVDKARLLLRKAPLFEKMLSEDAARPGPVERVIAQSEVVMRALQCTIGLKIILIANACDIFLQAIAGYIHSIFYSWKMARAVHKRLQRHWHCNQLVELAEEAAVNRIRLGRLLGFSGLYIEQYRQIFPPQKSWQQALAPTFALQLTLEIRGHLDDMKRDLSLLTAQQSLKLAKKTVGDFLLNLLPNPLEVLVLWKDIFLLAFFMKYSRREIKQMYLDMVLAYQHLLIILRDKDAPSATLANYHLELLDYEWLLVENSQQQPAISDDPEQLIEQLRCYLQCLLQILSNPQQFIAPRCWTRCDLLREMQIMAKSGHYQPQYLLEWERWLRTQVAKNLQSKDFVLDAREKAARLCENQNLYKRSKLQQILGKKFL